MLNSTISKLRLEGQSIKVCDTKLSPGSGKILECGKELNKCKASCGVCSGMYSEKYFVTLHLTDKIQPLGVAEIYNYSFQVLSDFFINTSRCPSFSQSQNMYAGLLFTWSKALTKT